MTGYELLDYVETAVFMPCDECDIVRLLERLAAAGFVSHADSLMEEVYDLGLVSEHTVLDWAGVL